MRIMQAHSTYKTKQLYRTYGAAMEEEWLGLSSETLIKVIDARYNVQIQQKSPLNGDTQEINTKCANKWDILNTGSTPRINVNILLS